jgi:flagellar biosynthesis protein
MEMEDHEKKAVALKREEDGSLRVVACGTGRDAEAIIEKAREHDIEIVQDRDEVEKILKGDEKPAIPEKIYALVSEIVSFVTELNEAWINENLVSGEEELTKTEE